MSDELKVPRTALLDGDIIAYQTAAWAHARQVDGLEMLDRLDAQVVQWTQGAFAQRAIICLSCSRDTNFRRDFWPEYKAHRDGHEDPPGRASCVEHLRSMGSHLQLPRLEADDLMGYLGSRETLKDGTVPVIVTIDKDLRQVPGWHWNPDKEDFPVRVTLEEADRFFYQQWMTGDATDNIPGLFKWGPVKAQKLLDAFDRNLWDIEVQRAYAEHPQKYPADYCLAMARCVRILRAGEVVDGKPVLWTPAAPVEVKPEPEQTPVITPTKTRTKKANKTRTK